MAKNTPPIPLTAAATRQPRGRPARLSHDAIVVVALDLLESHSVDDVTLNAVAKALGAPVMSIYKYFPNRDALMLAAATRVFSLLELPPQRDTWQDTTLDWLWALYRHCERYPVAFKVMDVNNASSSAILGVHAQFLKLFRGAGLRDADLALGSTWFFVSAVGLIGMHVTTSVSKHSIRLGLLEELPEDDQVVLMELRQYLPEPDQPMLLEFGFRQLLNCIERMLPDTSS